MGIDQQVALEITRGSAASSWMPAVSSAVDIFVKDFGLVLEAGRDCKAALPIAALAHQLFLASSGRGDGARDDSQVIRNYGVLNSRPTGRHTDTD